MMTSCSKFVRNFVDTYDTLLRKDVDGYRKHILNHNNDMIKHVELYRYCELLYMWNRWAESRYMCNLKLSLCHVIRYTVYIFIKSFLIMFLTNLFINFLDLLLYLYFCCTYLYF